jgi:3-hydroxyisobutyrate dehydrogenase
MSTYDLHNPTQSNAMTNPHIGFIGIGLMGEAMVRRLLAQGYAVTVWNREPERLATVLPYGALEAASPQAVATACDIVFLCVLGDEAVHQCVLGKDGVLAAPTRRAHSLVDCSTTSPAATRSIAEQAAAHKLDWIDAPISGGPPAALTGQLTIMAGGEEHAFKRVSHVLHALASNITHMGPCGAGQTTKAINQAIVGAGFALMTEAVMLAEAAGIDAKRLPEALAGGLADGALLQRIFPAIAARNFDPPLGYAPQLSKDLDATRDMAQALGCTLPLVEKAAERFAQYVAQSDAHADSRSLILYKQD